MIDIINDMNLRDLQYAQTLAATLHFGEAARRCNVSQSTLSIQIKKLEASLGVTLFERDGKTVRLSDMGLALIPRMTATLQAADDIRAHANQLRDPLAGTLRFGAFPTLAPYLLPHIMPMFLQHFPKLRVELVEEKTETLLEQLLSGTLDAALIALPVEQPRLDAIALFAEPFVLALRHDHTLAQKKQVTLPDLTDLSLLLLDDGHCLRAQALAFCARIGKDVSQSYRATSLETLRHMIASGAGVTLVPALAATPSPLLRYLPFAAPQPQREIALVFRASTTRRVLYTRMAREIRGAVATVKPLKTLGSSSTSRHDSTHE